MGGKGAVGADQFETEEHVFGMLLGRRREEVPHKYLPHVIGQRVDARVHALFPPRYLLHLFNTV